MARPLRAAGSGVAAAARAFARGVAAVAQAVADRWFLLDVYMRRRLTILAAIAAAVLVIALVAVPALPCRFPGGDRCPQADHAIELVPADALAYVHVDIDSSNDQYRAAAALADRLPKISGQLTGRLEAGLAATKAAGLAPGEKPARWLGGEAAVAVMFAGGELTTTELLAVENPNAAEAFARSLGTRGKTESYRGIDVRSGSKASTAILNGFLVAGPTAAVRRVIDVGTGVADTPPLAGDPAADEARAGLPNPRFADAYLSADGVRGLVSGRRAPLAAFAPLLAPGASRGATVAAVASGGTLELSAQSLLDRASAKRDEGVLAMLPAFSPTLAAELPAGSLAYFGVGHPARGLRGALKGTPGILGPLAGLLGGIGPADLTVLARRLLPALGPEAALAVEPPSVTAGVATTPPQLQIVASGVDAKAAKRALATVDPRPPSDLSGGRLLIAGDPKALAALKDPKEALDASPLFGQATDGLPSMPSFEAYLDLSGLVPLFETAGLAENPAYASFAGEIRRLQALGVAVESAPHELTTNLRLVVAGTATVANLPDRR
jgi:hypothetical protein